MIRRLLSARSDRAAVVLNDGSPTLLEQIPAGTAVSGVLPFEMPAGAPPVAPELPASPGVRVRLSRFRSARSGYF